MSAAQGNNPCAVCGLRADAERAVHGFWLCLPCANALDTEEPKSTRQTTARWVARRKKAAP